MKARREGLADSGSYHHNGDLDDEIESTPETSDTTG